MGGEKGYLGTLKVIYGDAGRFPKQTLNIRSPLDPPRLLAWSFIRSFSYPI